MGMTLHVKYHLNHKKVRHLTTYMAFKEFTREHKSFNELGKKLFK